MVISYAFKCRVACLFTCSHPLGVERRAGDVAAAAGPKEVLRHQPPLAERGSSQLQEAPVNRTGRIGKFGVCEQGKTRVRVCVKICSSHI